MPKPTALQRLADLTLGQPVGHFIHERRAAGASFHDIATALRDHTGNEVDVTVETVRQWHAAHRAAEASA